MRPTVTTNGTLLDDERISWLSAERFLVAISCDGVRAAHERNRKDAAGVSTYTFERPGRFRRMFPNWSFPPALLFNATASGIYKRSDRRKTTPGRG